MEGIIKKMGSDFDGKKNHFQDLGEPADEILFDDTEHSTAGWLVKKNFLGN